MRAFYAVLSMMIRALYAVLSMMTMLAFGSAMKDGRWGLAATALVSAWWCAHIALNKEEQG